MKSSKRITVFGFQIFIGALIGYFFLRSSFILLAIIIIVILLIWTVIQIATIVLKNSQDKEIINMIQSTDSLEELNKLKEMYK